MVESEVRDSVDTFGDKSIASVNMDGESSMMESAIGSRSKKSESETGKEYKDEFGPHKFEIDDNIFMSRVCEMGGAIEDMYDYIKKVIKVKNE